MRTIGPMGLHGPSDSNKHSWGRSGPEAACLGAGSPWSLTVPEPYNSPSPLLPGTACSLSAACLLRSFSIVFAQVAALASLACALSVMLTLPTTEPQSTDLRGV